MVAGDVQSLQVAGCLLCALKVQAEVMVRTYAEPLQARCARQCDAEVCRDKCERRQVVQLLSCTPQSLLNLWTVTVCSQKIFQLSHRKHLKLGCHFLCAGCLNMIQLSCKCTKLSLSLLRISPTLANSSLQQANAQLLQ